MKLIKPSYVIEHLKPRKEVLACLERYGRTCYKSEDRIQEGSAEKFCKMLLGRNHLSVIEHEHMTVRIICDRGVTHELVRHRLASYSQESTRYCNYSGEVVFIVPPWGFDEWTMQFLEACEREYQRLLEAGQSPQQARAVLPNCLKTEIVATANLREWMHIFEMRCAKAAHPQMREIMVPLQRDVQGILPELFSENIK